MAAMLMRSGSMHASISPMYRKQHDSLEEMSLDQIQQETGDFRSFEFSSQSGFVENEGEVPVLSSQPSLGGTMSKFSRAIKRLKAARRAGGDIVESSLARKSNDYFRIKQLVTRGDVRHDVVKLEAFFAKGRSASAEFSSEDFSGGGEPFLALDPTSFVIIIWNLVQFLLFAYILIFIPYRVSFASVGSSSEDCGKDAATQAIDLFMDTFYLVDLFVSACTQAISNTGLPLMHLKDTVPHYLLSWNFVRDVVPAAPMSWIEYASAQDCSAPTVAQSMGVGPEGETRNSSNENLIKLLRIMRVFRILRVFKLFNVEFVSRLLRQIDPNLKTLASLFGALLCLVHLLACLWFFVKRDSPSILEWYEEQGLSSGDNDSRAIRIYLSCVYYIVATLATVGYGDISGDHMEERMLAVAIMLVGTVVFALIISTASMIVQNSSADDAAHGAKIAVVHQFCSSWNISENLKKHILDFLLLSKDVFVDNTNSSTVLTSLPPDFQCIVTPFLAKDCISRTALFKNCSPEFVSLLLEYLSLETFNANDTIFRTGDVSHSLYIMKSGTCLLINNHNVAAAEMSDNDVFGDVSCFLSEQRLHTCVCLRFCEVYVLTASKLASIMKLFPDFYTFFSNFCRKKILADASAKRQFSAASCELPPHPSMPSSPSLTSRPPPLSPPPLPPPALMPTRAKLSALEPLPKGKYRPPKSPEVAQRLWDRTSRLTHEERVRIFAEIQMALSTYDFLSLASKYDRIMNAARRLEIIQDASKKYKQAEVLKSIIALLGQIVSAYDMPFHIDSYTAPSDHAHVHSNSLALHLAPGQTAWTASGGGESSIDMTSGDTFFGFVMNLASRLDPAVLVDKRTHAAAQHLAT